MCVMLTTRKTVRTFLLVSRLMKDPQLFRLIENTTPRESATLQLFEGESGLGDINFHSISPIQF